MIVVLIPQCVAFARIGAGEMMIGSRVIVQRAFQFVPRIIRQTVPVLIPTDEHDTRFTAAKLRIRNGRISRGEAA